MNSSEMRTLGRIGQPLSGGTYRPRRRFHAPRWLLLGMAVMLLAVIWVGTTASGQVSQPEASGATSSLVPPRHEAPAASRSGERESGATFATVGGMDLTLPHSKPAAVAFREASRVEALEMAPVGKLVANDNSTGFESSADTAGPEYRVLSSRGQARPATSAVDVVVPLGDDVLAPVTGEVTSVTQYPLYGGIRDWRIEVTPKGHRDMTVVLVHLVRPAVDVGDWVTAGRSPLAVARLLPFESDVDHVTDGRQPYVHIEVKPAVDSAPVDPNQPALPAEENSDF
ncbi:MAG: hypothetical protein GEU74_15095 [Nitriliruptorales bacterium]|nr:hypothetical protein [Nitriliruptorales bacterium]